jgi:hypothetical protein
MLFVWSTDVHRMSGGGLQLGNWDANLCSLHLMSWRNIHVQHWDICLHPMRGRNILHWDWGSICCHMHGMSGGDVQHGDWHDSICSLRLLSWRDVHVIHWSSSVHPVWVGKILNSLWSTVCWNLYTVSRWNIQLRGWGISLYSLPCRDVRAIHTS